LFRRFDEEYFTRHAMKILIFPFFLTLAWGCSNQQTDQIPEQFQELKNLTVYPTNVKSSETISFKKDAIYGNSDEVLIQRMGEIIVDSFGRVFISDEGIKVIYAFDPAGQFIDQLGSEGRGPGEFNSIKSLQIHKDQLFAFDFIQNRVNVFSLDTLIEEETIVLAKNRGNYPELQGSYPSIDELYVNNNNTYVAKFILSDNSNISNWQNIEVKGLYYMLDSNGKISRKLMDFTDAIRTRVPVRNASFDIPLTPFFGNALTVFSGENNIYRAEPDHFLIKVYNPKGVYQRAFYYPYKKISITRKSAIEHGIPDLLISNHDLFVKNMNAMDLPKTWPVLRDMKIDNQDRLWIAMTIENLDFYEWWVLEETGTLITRFDWPRKKPIEAVKNGFIYTRETEEESGLQQIVRYQIEFKEI